jgi:hypothetical protein
MKKQMRRLGKQRQGSAIHRCGKKRKGDLLSLPSAGRVSSLTLLGGLGDKTAEYGPHLSRRAAGRALHLALLPLLESEGQREVLFAFRTMKVICWHKFPSLGLLCFLGLM